MASGVNRLKGQDREQRVSQRREWQIIKVYEVEESAFEKPPLWGTAHYGFKCNAPGHRRNNLP
jgi:hypothetical protein